MRPHQTAEEQYVEEIYRLTMRMESQGFSTTEAQQQLVELGLPSEIAQVVIANVASRGLHRQEAASRNLKLGGIALVAGCLLTLCTYGAADPGGTYYVFYGGILIGAFWLLVGIFQRITSRNPWSLAEYSAAHRSARLHPGSAADRHDWTRHF